MFAKKLQLYNKPLFFKVVLNLDNIFFEFTNFDK